ncbi:hypothetical protein HPB47_021174 [Ixodes persulcatus]|uniref:Uncharacterized protein n=1 Tax=Ixodes persulcatus TaxID=34615 RepID=A0AC60QDJ6_IXOPE|nr:hypothetical protein HPB47_021174 [Ixodes persulcatus]
MILENVTTMGTWLSDYNWTGCLGMVNHRVWLTILISLPIMSIVLWVVARSSPAHAQLDPRRREAGLVKFFNCFWYLYGALLQQGGVHLPAASSARIILGFWWIYVLVVMAYYSSNLIAFLTVPEIRWIVSSFENAVDREDLHIYIPYGTGLHQEIQVHCTYLVSLTLEIFRLQSTGMLELLLKNHAEYTHPCIRDYSMHAQGNSRPIGVRELEGVFLLLLLGTAISLITMPVELLVGLKFQREKMDEIFQQTTKKKRQDTGRHRLAQGLEADPGQGLLDHDCGDTGEDEGQSALMGSPYLLHMDES